MKKVFAVAIGCVLIFTGFMAGRWMEYSKTGYHYQMLKETKIESEAGPVYTRYGVESVGSPMLVPETSILEVDGRIVYKATRIFQEKVPVLQNVHINNGFIEWEDGEYAFSLRMQRLVPEKNPVDE